MNTKQFIKKFNYAPYSEEEMAELVIKHIEDNVELVNAASLFIKNKGKFVSLLEGVGFEWG